MPNHVNKIIQRWLCAGSPLCARVAGVECGGWGVGQRKESLEVWPEGVLCAGRQPRVRKALVWAWWERGCSKFPGASELGKCPSRAQGPLCWRLHVSCGVPSARTTPGALSRKRLLPPALRWPPPHLESTPAPLLSFSHLAGLTTGPPLPYPGRPFQAPGFRTSTP